MEVMVEFQWFRDPAGYTLLAPIPAILPARGPGTSLLGGRGEPGRPQRIVRNGGELKPYQPLLHFKGQLYKRFAADALTPEGILKFVRDFGPLTQAGLKQDNGDDVEFVIEHARAMNGSWMQFSNMDINSQKEWLGNNQIDLIEPTLSLLIDPITKSPIIKIAPKSLLDALWLDLGQSISSKVVTKVCQYCHEDFEAGVGRKRRIDAKFCCGEHRVAFNNARKREGVR